MTRPNKTEGRRRAKARKSSIPRRRERKAAPASSARNAMLMPCRSRRSSGLDPWIDEKIAEVDQEKDDEGEKRREQDKGLQRRIVGIDHRLDAVLPEAA